ncbi:condensation domain-containing protein, partial [Peribacillus simplex]|uniref:condensation domain-containing protein n=1 Tax=Peribacillus simplex TaxID=1478 RepID=UPI003D278536
LRKIPDRGIGYGILKYLTPKEKHSIPFKLKPEVSFNYLGEMDGGLKEEGIQGSFLSVGDQISPESERLYPIDITGVVLNGKLQIDVNYNNELFNTIDVFLESFKTELLYVIEHCDGKKTSELTPSDLGMSELTLESLADIEKNLAINLKL